MASARGKHRSPLPCRRGQPQSWGTTRPSPAASQRQTPRDPYKKRPTSTSRRDHREISVQLARVTKGQPRSLVTGPTARSAPLTAVIHAIPELTARVRFPSPLQTRQGLHDRPSRPHTTPHLAPALIEAQVRRLRTTRKGAGGCVTIRHHWRHRPDTAASARHRESCEVPRAHPDRARPASRRRAGLGYSVPARRGCEDGMQEEPPRLRTDVQAALTVIGHRNARQDRQPIDLRGANLVGANLRKAKLADAKLDRVNLYRVDLAGANLTHAMRIDANLRRASFMGATLAHALMNCADLTGANIQFADLTGAELAHADLGRAVLSGAKLTRTVLDGANFDGVDLSGARLHDVRINGDRLDVRPAGSRLRNGRTTAKTRKSHARRNECWTPTRQAPLASCSLRTRALSETRPDAYGRARAPAIASPTACWGSVADDLARMTLR
ncbi:hypothetical protein FH610_040810 [Microbispora catharanthi]|uniref:Pentapeptide repeat-containing protein n=2 Tax=Microbispora catharanthi TaxID=1712871 RepID=A0A5N6AZP2_9ACTN|nr:hypothetical protein FH610_040810 [Microbispora catharanthi]